jgi:hypothetical protein
LKLAQFDQQRLAKLRADTAAREAERQRAEQELEARHPPFPSEVALAEQIALVTSIAPDPATTNETVAMLLGRLLEDQRAWRELRKIARDRDRVAQLQARAPVVRPLRNRLTDVNDRLLIALDLRTTLKVEDEEWALSYPFCYVNDLEWAALEPALEAARATRKQPIALMREGAARFNLEEIVRAVGVSFVDRWLSYVHCDRTLVALADSTGNPQYCLDRATECGSVSEARKWWARQRSVPVTETTATGETTTTTTPPRPMRRRIPTSHRNALRKLVADEESKEAKP